MGQIRIDSILGGHQQLLGFARKDQFQDSLGIDPGQPHFDNNFVKGSGYLRPTSSQKISGTTVTNAPLWIRSQPKNSTYYIYDAAGSAYTLDLSTNTVTALSDAGALSSSSGNGCEYYDNYMYFAKNTDIARYGPLNGAPTFNATYWTSTLGKAALTNTTYPADVKTSLKFPNHTMHRHSDGKLYISDIVGNQGTLHVISTTKAAVEGDTDNSSTASKLTFGYGLWPTALESYGQNIAIALYEGSSTASRRTRAKLAFWDTTSTSFNSITWVEFPDPIITAMKNVDGVLYIASGTPGKYGTRISQFVGGYTFKTIAYIEGSQPPFAGAVDGSSRRFLFGSESQSIDTAGCVWAVGLQSDASSGLFNIQTVSQRAVAVTALSLNENSLAFDAPVVGWSDGSSSSGTFNGVDVQTSIYGSLGVPNTWVSQSYKIGQPFQIKRIRIPLAQAMGANQIITPSIQFDDDNYNQTLTTINNTTFPGAYAASIKTAGDGTNILMGQNDLALQLQWTGTALSTVAFPILIDFEIIPD